MPLLENLKNGKVGAALNAFTKGYQAASNDVSYTLLNTDPEEERKTQRNTVLFVLLGVVGLIMLIIKK